MSNCITINWTTPEELREKIEGLYALFVDCGVQNHGDSGEPTTLSETTGVEEQSSIPSPEPVASSSIPSGVETHQPDAMPSARQLADELGVNLSDVTGSGKNGRITKKDVQNHAESLKPEPPQDEEPPAPVADDGQEQNDQGQETPVAPEQPVDTPTSATLEDCKNALQKTHEQQGINTCREILQEFGAGKLSELSEDKYGAFVQRCQQAATKHSAEQRQNTAEV